MAESNGTIEAITRKVEAGVELFERVPVLFGSLWAQIEPERLFTEQYKVPVAQVSNPAINRSRVTTHLGRRQPPNPRALRVSLTRR